jgi:putative transposase
VSRYRIYPIQEQERALLEHCSHARYVWNTVRQQALRDFAQAMAGFFADTHGRPSWRKAGRNREIRRSGMPAL